MSPYSFEVVGDTPSAWLDDLERFAVRLRAHPWGGQAADLLLCGDLPELLREYMPPPRYAEWEHGFRAGRVAVTGAISFTARDGRRAAAVFPLDDRSMRLMFAGHEFAEGALDRRHDVEGHVFEDGTHTSVAHVLWTEYVVERTRRQIFDELALGYSVLDNDMVSEQIADIERELPELIRWAVQYNDLPPRIIQQWYELARVYAMSLGRADVGSPNDLADLEIFRRHRLIRESSAGWKALDGALRGAYDSPEAVAADLDVAVRDGGWWPLYETGLGAVWNGRYAAAGGH